MKLVFQKTSTDCLTAAIASVTGIPLSDCPSVWNFSGQEWLDRIRIWAATYNLGFCYFDLKDRTSWPMLDGIYCVVGGHTPRSGKFLHAVVAHATVQDGKTILVYVHDPFPGGSFIVGPPDHVMFFLPGACKRCENLELERDAWRS